ncbi:lipocalin [Alteromonas pelagimontana]|uniref:Outer membrane lipoprotein Blc n=2 Tax=Alteromonas pelagimontana TaxID=1858656 RepID=A0A6M4MIU5_9ALTE|nr:lipocalin family protein [Alteromonas pelagimontana]QJR82838.1 lipocalin [Alteromonas pelagimontana]
MLSCTGKPEQVTPVSPFNIKKYLGKWYEIARFPHSFEEGLSHVTATYSVRKDGGIDVLNKGFNDDAQKWEEAKGEAYFVEDENTGYLKVSFFGPFYASYIIVALDQADYQYALVTGPDKEYLWVLSRTPELDEKIVDKLLKKAQSLGYDLGKIIYVDQSAMPSAMQDKPNA